MSEHFLAITVLSFWNETLKYLLDRLNRDETIENSWLDGHTPQLSRDLASLSNNGGELNETVKQSSIPGAWDLT